jgi:hypothetical protein
MPASPIQVRVLGPHLHLFGPVFEPRAPPDASPQKARPGCRRPLSHRARVRDDPGHRAARQRRPGRAPHHHPKPCVASKVSGHGPPTPQFPRPCVAHQVANMCRASTDGSHSGDGSNGSWARPLVAGQSSGRGTGPTGAESRSRARFQATVQNTCRRATCCSFAIPRLRRSGPHLECSDALALKTGMAGDRHRGFESHTLRFCCQRVARTARSITAVTALGLDTRTR